MGKSELRTPICSVLGHVDVGKTLFLDKLRNTRVQSNESGGITQQIGATYFSLDTLNNLSNSKKKMDIPGLLFIDTPGHDCFSSLRIRGAEICDIAIVIVDIIKGLEKQTISSIKLLREKKVPFVIALNKLDRIADWKSINEICSLKKCFKNQIKRVVKKDIDDYANKIICQLAKLEINAALYYKNNDPKSFVSMVPISAKTGEGMADLLMLIASLSNKYMKKKLVFHEDKARGYVMEITKDNQLGNLLNVILTDGILNNKDKVIFCGSNGCIETEVKKIFLPNEKEELRDKAKFTSVNSVIASKGLMLKVLNSDKVVPGTEFFRIANNESKDDYEAKIQEQIEKNNLLLDKKEYDELGVFINGPSSGVLEALWNLMKDRDYEIGGMTIGPVQKQTIMKVSSINENITRKYSKGDRLYYSRYSVLLVYDSKASSVDDYSSIDKKVVKFANEQNVKILVHNTVYRLITAYEKYENELSTKLREMYPFIVPRCEFEIIPKYVFLKCNPLLFGVKVLKNKLVKGMLVEAVLNDKTILLGRVSGIQRNKTDVEEARINEEVCIRIERIDKDDEKYEYDKDFTSENILRTHYEEDDIMMLKRYSRVLSIE